MWDHGTVIDLGALDGGYYSYANDVNSQGVIAGISETGNGYAIHAVLWKR